MPATPVQRCLSADAAAAYAAGRLTRDELSLVDDHIDSCVTCRQMLSRAAELATPPPGESAIHSHEAAAPPAHGLSPGEVVGRYVVDACIGAGGMGVVYAVHDPELGRKVALKVLRLGLASAGRSAEDLLRREAMAMARIAHPNVVGVHDLLVVDGTMFVAMEFIEGSTLRHWLRAERRSWREVLRVMLLAGRGLSAAHAEGVIHRDLKPENILVGQSGRVCVSDFGLARLAAAPAAAEDTARAAPGGAGSTIWTVAGGTPRYMAPEQRSGHSATAKSDQFGFCVVLYEGLYGQHPFGKDAADRPRREVEAAPATAKVPARIRKALLRGLSVDAERRYASMDALLAQLGGEPRRRWTAGAAAALAVLSLGGIGLAYRQGRAQFVPVCSGVDAKLSGVWDAARKSAAHDAFLATGRPWAADAWRGGAGALDAYARDWGAMRGDACLATRVRGEQSTEVLDLRMACLDDRLRELGALGDLFSHADEDTVTHALAAAGALTPLAVCADVKALKARVRPPTDAATTQKVDELQSELAHVKALADAGKYRDALPLAEKAAAAAEATGYAPTLADALLQWATLRGLTGDLDGAEPLFYRAAFAADSAGDDRARALVWGQLLFFVGDLQAKHDLVPLFRSQAEAAIARLGGDDEREASLLGQVGNELISEGKADQAVAPLERSLAMQQELFGERSLAVCKSLVVLGRAYASLGNIDRSLELTRRSLEVGEELLGSEHPSLALALNDIGSDLMDNLRFAEAEPYLRRAVSMSDAAPGKHTWLAMYLDNLGESLLEQGRYRDALACHERALAIREETFRPNHPLLVDSLLGLGRSHLGLKDPLGAIPYLERALVLPPTDTEADAAAVKFALARALTDLHRDSKRAITLATEARDVLAKETTPAPIDVRERESVEAWLACETSKPPRPECLTSSRALP